MILVTLKVFTLHWFKECQTTVEALEVSKAWVDELKQSYPNASWNPVLYRAEKLTP